MVVRPGCWWWHRAPPRIRIKPQLARVELGAGGGRRDSGLAPAPSVASVYWLRYWYSATSHTRYHTTGSSLPDTWPVTSDQPHTCPPVHRSSGMRGHGCDWGGVHSVVSSLGTPVDSFLPQCQGPCSLPQPRSPVPSRTLLASLSLQVPRRFCLNIIERKVFYLMNNGLLLILEYDKHNCLIGLRYKKSKLYLIFGILLLRLFAQQLH